MPKKTKKPFQVFKDRRSDKHGVAVSWGPIIGGLATKGKAAAIADGLNRVIRELTTVRKSPGKHARRKGHSFEREVAIALREVWPKARRHLEYQDSEANGVDIAETGEFKFQCKKLKGYAPVSKIREIQYDELLGEVPVLVTAADGEPALAVLPFTDLIRLLKK